MLSGEGLGASVSGIPELSEAIVLCVCMSVVGGPRESVVVL